mmetsp:Transcript_6493/g.14691  ORF Transcript_6493/g.14691 Transcript_6493/m.14691 type:complete len:782 (-) Transcript_6493:2150-4495(-)|eukprot:CAMPEP_0172332138 /NCGR_PEP_ID=MMETSP1058-20130122/62282_1 /TAXON_ID=83371 /ORGANISM="Detonula confervacea, Strain CCMP 353" /LENGTH=781 /DNA_ID=CAMNT_0013049415 /DNA_START=61 /DNA_END=2406 /DNA_ORIENTATION=+
MRTFETSIMVCFILQLCRGSRSRWLPAHLHASSFVVHNHRHINLGSNAGGRDGRDIISAPRPRATSSSNTDLNQHEQQHEEPNYESMNQQEYSNAQNYRQQRQKQQQQEQPTSSDVQSMRSRYQFQTVQLGSTRRMPPTTSEYDESYNNYNVGDNDDENLGNDDANVPNLFDNNNDEKLGNVDADVPTIFDNPVKKEVNFFDDVEEGGPVKRTATAVPNKIQNERDAEQGTAAEKTAMDSSTPSYPRSIPPRVIPSFMEPVKTKAILIDSNSNTDSENNNGDIAQQRNLPMEASNGGSSTSQLTIIGHQLEHLTSQIYQLNKGLEFNINSPKQVARVLFGDDSTGDTSTNKDVLEAMASAGNEMAGCIYKFRKLSREVKREKRRVEQVEKGDKKNDYYGNLARLDAKNRNVGNSESVSVAGIDGETQGSNKADVKIFETVTSTSQQTMTDDDATIGHHRREPLILIDTSAYIYRAYHAIPPLHHSDGTPTGALHGVCRMLQNLLLNRLLKGEQPHVVLCFDFKGPNFRHEVYPEYKANRGPCPEDLVPQFGLVREAAEAFGVVQVEAEGYEADDVIATLARQALRDGVDVDIFSGDKDLMQLITPIGIEPKVHMIDPLHFDRVDHDDVVKKWGVSSEKLGDVLALAGDSADNIPGAPGIGPKIAAALINEYGTLSNVIAQADGIKQNKRRESIIENAEKLLLFRKLVTLDDSIPINEMTLPSSFQDVSTLRMSTFDPNRLIDFYKRMELNACQKTLESRLRSGWVNFKPPPTPEEYEGVPF